MLQAFFEGAVELIFPDNCLICRRFLNSRHQRQLCAECLDSLEFNPAPFSRQSTAGLYAFDHAWSCCLYNNTAQKLLHSFKYNSKTGLSKTIVSMMVEFIDRHYLPMEQFELIAPIPLHPARLWERGYNQSAFLSEALGRHYNLMHEENLLCRCKPTTTQTELGAKQRWTNMEAAFKIKNPSLPPKDKIILLVDDLLTTGATLHHAALALKNAGAARVGVLTFCVAL